MAIGAVIFVHRTADNGIGCCMAVVASTVGGLQDKTSGHMVWSGMIEEIRGMTAVAGTAGVWHSGTDYCRLAVTNGRPFQDHRGGSPVVTGLAAIGGMNADQEIRIGMTAHATVKG